MHFHVEMRGRNTNWVAVAILPSKILIQVWERSDVKREVRASRVPQTSLFPWQVEACIVGKEGRHGRHCYCQHTLPSLLVHPGPSGAPQGAQSWWSASFFLFYFIGLTWPHRHCHLCHSVIGLSHNCQRVPWPNLHHLGFEQTVLPNSAPRPSSSSFCSLYQWVNSKYSIAHLVYGWEDK